MKLVLHVLFQRLNEHNLFPRLHPIAKTGQTRFGMVHLRYENTSNIIWDGSFEMSFDSAASKLFQHNQGRTNKFA